MRKILLYFAIKYEGNYNLIYNAIKKKEKVSNEDINKITNIDKYNYITILDSEYPQKLKTIANPPFVLFYFGDISLLNKALPNIVVIGTRNNTTYGETMTKKIVNDLKNGEYIISSGLARGIDRVVHETALECNLPTIAVLGCGVNVYYPVSNADVYQKIKEKGLLLSEYPNDLKAKPEHFLVRNRILAALSDIIVIIEAKHRSGTVNTVAYGLEYGKDICCVPALATANSGCNHLIKQGAKLIENGRDIFD